MMRNVLSIFMIAGMVVALTGCPPFPVPPFDATGEYVGEWWGSDEEQTQEITACPLTLSLTQNPTLPWPSDHGVEGTVTIDFSCLELPEWVDDALSSTVQVSGVVADDGTFTLASGACGTGLCVVLVLTGQGSDLDADGLMDSYGGDWSYRILLAGVAPFGIDGGFEVTAQ